MEIIRLKKNMILDVIDFLRSNGIKQIKTKQPLDLSLINDNKLSYSDCIINIEGGPRIYVHKIVLAARSLYFHTLFSEQWHGTELNENYSRTYL